MKQNIFEIASRKRFRFQTEVGVMSTEDLWDISMKQLEKIANGLVKQINAIEAPSVFSGLDGSASTKESKELESLNDQLDLLKYVFQVRTEENRAKLEEAQRKQQKARLDELIERKRETALESMSIDELIAMRGSLG